MVSKLAFNITASFIIVLRRFIQLIFTPYKTMRSIAVERDYAQIALIGMLIFGYFFISSALKERPMIQSIFFMVHGVLTVLFFFALGRFFRRDVTFSSVLFTLTYSFLPTLLWFVANLLLYVAIPPPRTLSLLSKSFSIFYITFSLSLLFWKIQLLYLAVRFSTKQNVDKVIYFMLLYALYLIPYIYGLYLLKVSRVPFV